MAMRPARRTDTLSDADDWAPRVRAGDSAAFEAMFYAHYAGLRAFIVGYVKDPDVADDVVQDLFLRVWRQRVTFALHGTAKTYLYATARNCALGHLARRRVERAWAVELAYRDPPSAEPADAVARERETAVAIAHAIDALPSQCKMVFLLRRSHGLTTAEIAQVLNLAPKSVEQYLWRATSTLRQRLARFFPVALLLTHVASTVVSR